VSATAAVHVVAQPVHYVAADSTNPLPPYTSWATAATNIQEAVDAATVSGALVLVSNGVYAGGLEVNKPLAVRGVSGPERTVVDGGGSVRCVYLASGASLAGFTLTNGRADYGGGVRCESASVVVSNCVLTGNFAGRGGGAFGGTLDHCVLTGNHSFVVSGGGAAFCTLNHCTLTANWVSGPYGSWGGGADSCTLNNCTLSGNSAGSAGGGAYGGRLNNCALTANWAENGGGAAGSTLNHCTLTANWAGEGGGAFGGTLNNCIAYFNTATNGVNHLSSTLNFCCTTPMPTNGIGNITNAPLFVDYAGGNLRLQSNSPCINAGNNAYVTSATDLNGHPRIIGGTADIGAYENTDGATASGLPWAWLLGYGLPTDGSADYVDFDADGHTTWQEWRCQTCPTNTLSVLRLLPAFSGGANVTVTWQSVAGVTYFLERSTNVAGPPPIFASFGTSIPGQSGTTSYTDTNAAALTPLFYRVGVP